MVVIFRILIVAIVGETGAGKSTLVNLACRFFEPTSGQILIDGRDYRERSQLWLHSSIGYVLQNPHLFSGTVMDNIRYGRLDATDEECIAAAKLANADGFIRRLPEGYQTVLTGDGPNLSQGQRQLLSIARAAVADPPVLILDEATSSIDTRTETLVQEGMDRLMGEADRLVPGGAPGSGAGAAAALIETVARDINDDRAVLLLWRD